MERELNTTIILLLAINCFQISAIKIEKTWQVVQALERLTGNFVLFVFVIPSQNKILD